MVYRETKIKNTKHLKEILDALDPDEGIRILGNMSEFKKGGFIFINKPSNYFIVNLCDRVYDKQYMINLPGGKDEFINYSSSDEVLVNLKIKFAIPFIAALY
tara:strand:- start:279 stop:584 length:306 start_codon:yes stop_codon:yes gene_type:complete